MHRVIWLITWLVFAPTFTAAQEAPKCDSALPSASIAMSGSDTFVLTTPEAGKPSPPVTIYLQTDAVSPPLPQICVARVALNGQERPELTGSVLLTAQNDTAGLLRINAEVKALQFRSQGQWKITGVVSWPAAAKPRAQFSFVLVRKPALLQVAATPKFRIDDSGKLSPPDIPVHEIGSESGIQSLSAWLDPVSNTAEGITPTLTFAPVALTAGGLATLTPQSSGQFPLGVSTTKLTLTAPELAAPVVVSVDVLRRRSYCLLLLFLAAGVLASFLIRGLLAAQITLDDSRLAAATEVVRIAGIAQQEADPVVRQALSSVARALETTYSFERTATNIDKAKTDRAAEADTIVRDAAQRKTALHTNWDRDQKLCCPAVPLDPAVAAIVRPICERLTAIERLIGQGMLFEPEARLREIDDLALPRLVPNLQQWAAALGERLTDLANGKMPGAFSSEANQLAGQAPTVKDIGTANTFAGQLRQWIDHRADRQLGDELLATVSLLRSAKLDPLADAWTISGNELRATVRHTSVPDLTEALAPLGRFRAQLVATLRQSADAAVQQALRDDNLPAALAALAGGTAATLAPVPPDAPVGGGAGFTPPIVLSLSADYIITSPSLIPLRKQTSLRLIAPYDLSSDCTYNWQGANPDAVDKKKATIDPQRSGFFDVSCEVNDSGGTLLGQAHAVLLAGGESAVIAAQSGVLKRLFVEQGVGTLVSAVVAVATGYLMFEANWVGKPVEWMTAFMWGFAIDLGLAKVSDIARPITSRITMPTSRN